MSFECAQAKHFWCVCVSIYDIDNMSMKHLFSISCFIYLGKKQIIWWNWELFYRNFLDFSMFSSFRQEKITEFIPLAYISSKGISSQALAQQPLQSFASSAEAENCAPFLLLSEGFIEIWICLAQFKWEIGKCIFMLDLCIDSSLSSQRVQSIKRKD